MAERALQRKAVTGRACVEAGSVAVNQAKTAGLAGMMAKAKRPTDRTIEKAAAATLLAVLVICVSPFWCLAVCSA